ncbi:MAG TPA: hypothetical protein VGP30_01745 [Candidatus Limnocylindrales bacterium]|nr:hypothetical protein [Candidatus Limnocylindrales bacterium]
MSLYPWMVFLHVAFVLMFVLGHGVSAAVGLRVRAEREPARIAALVDLSRWSINFAGIGLLGVLITGVVLVIKADWFRIAWPWVSIVLIVVIGGAMTPLARSYLDDVRLAVGALTGNKKKDALGRPLLPPDELALLLDSRKPLAAAAIGAPPRSTRNNHRSPTAIAGEPSAWEAALAG